MTDKRFTETLSTGIVTDHITGKEYKCEMRIDDDLLALLNELHEENHLLLKASEKDSELIKTLRKGIHQWRKENEWLKERIKELK